MPDVALRPRTLTPGVNGAVQCDFGDRQVDEAFLNRDVTLKFGLDGALRVALTPGANGAWRVALTPGVNGAAGAW